MMKEGVHWLYVRKGKIVAPVIAETSSGYMGNEPVRILKCVDTVGVSQIVRESISLGNPKGRGYLRDEFPPPVVLAPTNTRTWGQFAKGTASVGWEITPDRCVINKIKNVGAKGEAGYTPVVVREFVRSIGLEDFVEAVIREVQAACKDSEGPR